MVRTEGPDVAQTLWSLAWVLWGFGAFAVADIFMRRQLEIERLVGAIAKQERLATLGRLASVIAHQSRHHLGILNMSAYVLDETLAKETLSPGGARPSRESSRPSSAPATSSTSCSPKSCAAAPMNKPSG